MIKIFLTGPPGSGKTTAVMKLYETLKLYGYKVGGFITIEERIGGKRVGFKIIALDNKESGYLAHINFKTGPRIGKYRVDVKTLDEIGVGALRRGLKESDFIIVDEIGPMELTSDKFNKVIIKVLKSNKPAILTVHYIISTKLSSEYKTDKDNILYMITPKNREAIPFLIWREMRKRGILTHEK